MEKETNLGTKLISMWLKQMPAWSPTQGFALASPSPLRWGDSPFSPKVQL